jgi:hypothetical protein
MLESNLVSFDQPDHIILGERSDGLEVRPGCVARAGASDGYPVDMVWAGEPAGDR